MMGLLTPSQAMTLQKAFTAVLYIECRSQKGRGAESLSRDPFEPWPLSY